MVSKESFWAFYTKKVKKSLQYPKEHYIIEETEK